MVEGEIRCRHNDDHVRLLVRRVHVEKHILFGGAFLGRSHSLRHMRWRAEQHARLCHLAQLHVRINTMRGPEMLRGFDTSAYPGDAVMTLLRPSFDFCGFYLAPAPSHNNASWM